MTGITIAVESIGLVIALILLAYNFTEKSKDRVQLLLLRGMLSSNCLALILDMICYSLDGKVNMVTLLYTLKTITWFVGYLIILFYLIYLVKHLSTNKKKNKMLICFFIGYTILLDVCVLISLYDNLYFGYDAAGYYYKGRYYYVSQILGFSMFVFAILLIIRHIKQLGFYNTVSFFVYALAPVIGSIVNMFVKDISIFYTTTAVAAMIVYLSIHIKQEKLLQKQEADLMEANFKIMLSQIQPHFLFNALTCITDLCDTNPKVAKDTTIFFAHYLRNNLEAINNSHQIPFTQELKHIKNYLNIEKVRFEGLETEFNIKYDQFLIPILSIQPLVENAVKYGIGKNGNKGTITISTYKVDDYYVVEVSDDGAGFDVNNYKGDTSRSHLGIDSCRDRILTQAKGRFEIESKIGVGTVIKVFIPITD